MITDRAFRPVGPHREPHLRNFAEPDPGVLLRGAQPGLRGYWRLRHEYHARLVIDLREEAPDEARLEADEACLDYLKIPVEDNQAPTAEQVAEFLGAAKLGVGPVFLGCAKGCGRTGTFVACYRLAKMGWDLESAIAEAPLFAPRIFGIQVVRALTSPQLYFLKFWAKAGGYPLGD